MNSFENKVMKITKEQARSFLVHYHHLTYESQLSHPHQLLSYIDKVGCIQYDPINILSYNSHLTLQSRYEGYRAQVLDDLLYKHMLLIDGWDKNLSIYSIEDHTYLFKHSDEARDAYERLHPEVKSIIPTLIEKIKLMGPIASTDIKDSPQVDWWWAPTKAVRAALDYLFASNQVYVHHKVNTRKYYDLMENHPIYYEGAHDFRDHQDYLNWHIRRRIGGVGILPAKGNSYAYIAINGLKAKERRSCIDEMVHRGTLGELDIEGIETPYYVRADDLPLLDEVIKEGQGLYKHPKASIIAPLDNLIWDRQMIRDLFEFDYTWEVYKPKVQRVYGYYVLPILYKNRFIGRFEGKFNRQTNTLEIINWFFEAGVSVDETMLMAQGQMLNDFRLFLGASKIKMMPSCKNKKLVGQVTRYCRSL